MTSYLKQLLRPQGACVERRVMEILLRGSNIKGLVQSLLPPKMLVQRDETSLLFSNTFPWAPLDPMSQQMAPIQPTEVSVYGFSLPGRNHWKIACKAG